MTTSDAVRDLKSGTDDTSNDAKGGIGGFRGNLTEVAHSYRPTGGDAAQYAAQTYRDAKETAEWHLGDLERQIRDRPVQAALIAAGAGLLIGTLFVQWRGSRNAWSSFEFPSRRRLRMTRRRLREAFDNQVARAEHAWDSVQGSDRLRGIGRILDSQRRRWDH